MGRNRILRYLLCAGILWNLLEPSRAGAQIKANAAFDPARVETGDTFSLRILVTGAKVAPKRVDFAAWQNQLPAKNILMQSAWNRSGLKWVQQFTLIAFDSARLQLPPLTVHLHLGDTVQTNALELEITATSAGSDLSEMDQIRDIRREPVYWFDYWPWALGALAFLVLLVWLSRRRKKRPRPAIVVAAPPVIRPPAKEIALQKLAALENQELWQKGRLLEYYADLSIIVREYLEHQYAILALESTTREISTLLKNTRFPGHLKAPLDYLLQQADMIKYADMPPPAQYHTKAMESAVQVVNGES